MSELKRTCDFCGKVVDNDDIAAADDSDFTKYWVIHINVENRNPLKRRNCSSSGSVIACTDCMNLKVRGLPFHKIMNKMVDRVNED